jgi:hypothetical protein
MVKMTRHAKQYLSATAAIMMVFALAGYLYLNLSIIVIVNGSDVPLSDMSVRMVGELWWNGELESNHSKWLIGTIEGEGSVDISFNASGRSFTKSCGYYEQYGAVFDKIFLTEEKLYFETREPTALLGISEELFLGQCGG